MSRQHGVTIRGFDLVTGQPLDPTTTAVPMARVLMVTDPSQARQWMISRGRTPEEASRKVAEIQARHRDVKSRPCGRGWACYSSRQAATTLMIEFRLAVHVSQGDECGGWHISPSEGDGDE